MSLQTRLTALAQAVGGDIKTLNGKVQTATATLDPWHQVTVFQNSWVAYDSSVYYRKDIFGRVYLRGSLSGGVSGTIAFQLPVGYRPVLPGLSRVRTISIGNQLATGQWEAQVNVAPDGNVSAFHTAGAGVSAVSLDQVEFDSAAVTELSFLVTGAAQAAVPIPGWVAVGPQGGAEPAFKNNWVNWGSGEAALSFSKDPFGKVMIRGTIKGGANGTLIFTLPAGYWPKGNQTWTIPTASGAAQTTLSVTSAGGVSVSTVGTAIQATFIGVEFDTETVTQMPTGPQGPKGDKGDGVVGLMKDLDGLNFAPYVPVRSKLAFAGPNWTLSDGGPADGFGGGDFTKINFEPVYQVGGSLPFSGARNGQEIDLEVATGVTWRFRYQAGWHFVGGPPFIYAMRGENAAYFSLVSGNKIQVNATGKFLQWQFTPLVDVWAEVEFFIGLMQKVDANYHYLQLSAAITPGPVSVAQDNTATITQHASVQQFETYRVKGLYALSAGVAYTMYCTSGISGGSWQYHQAGNTIGMIGKAWPR